MTEISAYQKMYDSFKDEINNFEQRLIDISCDYNDSIRAYNIGLENVYNKFIELEKRQKEIELLLIK
jgi:hypothetical protein